MKNVITIVMLLLAFVAGYFTRGITQQEMPIDSSKTEHNAPAIKTADAKKSNEQLDTSTATKALFVDRDSQVNFKKPAVENRPVEKIPAELPLKDDSVSNNEPTMTPESKYPNEISDEEIDKIIPSPFNQSLKNRHGELREKYKVFASSNQQSNWDTNMQNKLSDAILGHPYAKFINLEFLQCKVNLCEIRLFETKEGAWSLIMAEMRLQDWWDIGGSSASGNTTDTPSKVGWHVLLPRR